MDKTQLNPVAEIMIPAYLNTASFSRQFRDEYEQPPSLAAKVHHMRAVIQAMVNKSDHLMLAEPYVEFGRVEITDQAGTRYLLRSEAAAAIERGKRDKGGQGSLFDSTRYLASEVILLVYKFHSGGLDLSVAGTRQEVGRTRLEASGEPDFIGTWPLSLEGESFNQGEGDAFAELGDLPGLGSGTGGVEIE